MSSSRKITKKQLKEDRFAETVFAFGEMARRHQRSIVGALALILILVVGGTWGARYFRSSGLESQQAFSKALKTLQGAIIVDEEAAYMAALDSFTEIRSNFAKRDVGKWAIYYEGYCYELNQQYKRSEQLYTEYLAADRGGEYEIPARLGLATALGSMGHTRKQAQALMEIASMKKISERQAQAWRLQAGRLLMDAGYFDDARSAFEGLLTASDASVKTQAEQELATLRALRS